MWTLSQTFLFISRKEWARQHVEMLQCPDCKNELSDFSQSTAIACSCGLTFPVESGVPLFSSKKDGQYSKEQITWLQELEQKHFWFRSRRMLITKTLKRFLKTTSLNILDVGCGSGETLHALQKEGFQVVGIDLQAEGLKERKRKTSMSLFQGDVGALPFIDHAFDALILADVLEHVEEDVLSEVFRVLAPGGILLVTVPAFRFLWSERDKQAGHLRRYARGDLRHIAKQYGCNLLFLSGFQFFLFPLFCLSRLLQKTVSSEEKILPLLNKMLFWINAFEVKMGIQWPLGSSFIAVYEKPF